MEAVAPSIGLHRVYCPHCLRTQQSLLFIAFLFVVDDMEGDRLRDTPYTQPCHRNSVSRSRISPEQHPILSEGTAVPLARNSFPQVQLFEQAPG